MPVTLDRAALGARLGTDLRSMALLQRAADAFQAELDQLRHETGVGSEVSDVALRQVAAELLVERTAQHLEAAGAKSAQLREGLAGPTHGGANALMQFRLAVMGPGHGGEGPEPVLKGPAPQDLARARTRLAVLAPGRKLSSEDARVLLQQAAWGTRQALAAVRWVRGLGVEAFAPQNIAGACGYGQATSAFHLQDLGVPAEDIHLHQAADAFGDGFRHAFVVVKMPDGKPYLVDCTFRQFFQPDNEGPDRIGEPGRIMRADRRGRAIADELLANGFIELTDEVAAAYGRALSTDPGCAVKARALLRSTAEIDYDRAEILGLPALPPLAQGPLPSRPRGPNMNRGPP